MSDLVSQTMSTVCNSPPGASGDIYSYLDRSTVYDDESEEDTQDEQLNDSG